jgi:hypothetical protein
VALSMLPRGSDICESTTGPKVIDAFGKTDIDDDVFRWSSGRSCPEGVRLFRVGLSARCCAIEGLLMSVDALGIFEVLIGSASEIIDRSDSSDVFFLSSLPTNGSDVAVDAGADTGPD